MRLQLGPVSAVTCNARREVVSAAEIHIEGGRIRWIGPAAEAPEFAAERVIGGEHLVAMPGLVNTHTHAAMTLLRGYADDMPLERWLSECIWPFERTLTIDDISLGTELAILEMVRGGTTTVADMYFGFETTVQLFIDSGVRACPGAVLLGFLPDAERKIQDGIAFVRDFDGAGDGRITPLLSPHSLYTCDRRQWEAIVAGAGDLESRINTHVAETESEVRDVTAKWGMSPMKALDSVGALEVGLIAAHAIHIPPGDRDLMQEFGVAVAHNPQSNLKLASGIAPVRDYLERGLAVGLGPDGPASNNNLDMWEEMRLAATLHKVAESDATAVTADEALVMATIGGARVLGLDDVTGSLEAGKAADIVLVDFDAPHLTPCHSVVSNLVYAAGAADVVLTMVDGRVLYEKGAWTTLEAERIKGEARRRGRREA